MAKRNFPKRVSRAESTPARRILAPVVKPKAKPRGTPFKVGNRYGLLTRFRKGEPSPNPNGRPSLKRLNAACVDVFAQVVPRDELIAAGLPIRLFGKTYAEVSAWILQQEGLRGNISAIAEAGDRAFGRPGVASPDDGEQSPLMILINSMDLRADQAGPAEGMQPKRLTQRDTDDRPDEETAAG